MAQDGFPRRVVARRGKVNQVLELSRMASHAAILSALLRPANATAVFLSESKPETGSKKV